MSKFGSCVPIFGGKYEWYPATHYVYQRGSDKWISDDCYTADQARAAVRAWWDYCSKKEATP